MPQSKRQRVTSLATEPPAPTPALHAPSSNANSIGRIRPTLPETSAASSASSTASRRPHLTPNEKLKVLDWHHANGRNQKATATHFRALPQYEKLSQGTVSRWLAAEAKIRQEANGSKSVTSDKTREKSLKHPLLEKCLTLWLEQLSAAQRARLSGREIKTTARQIYDELGVPESDRLELSNGWLGRFQTRHGLKLHRLHVEDKVDYDAAALEAEQKKLQDSVELFLAGTDTEDNNVGSDVKQRRALDDVWTLEMTTIFLDCSPTKVANDTTKDIEPIRISVGLAVNATGSERLEPIFVGCDSAYVQGFKYYYNNQVACLTPSVLCAWLRDWNKRLLEANRHVLLLVGKCGGKLTDEPDFSNIKLRFLSPLHVDHIQPCSAGLTKAFHAQYRKLLVHRGLNRLQNTQAGHITDGGALFQVRCADVMDLAKSAWELVGAVPKLATSCWQKAQILPAQEKSTFIEADEHISIAIKEEIVALEQALQVLSLEARSRNISLVCLSADEFVRLGLDEAQGNDLSVKEIVHLVTSHDQEHGNISPPSNQSADHEITVSEHRPATQESSTASADASPPPSCISLSPDIVLHAQLTLERYWAENHITLSPAVIQVLQQTRARLQQQASP
ncbi:unnamed protein product [Phytophthora lilii]|uniref:Unnamed protein product n=1 Tax=Phytophthora lilii TaxID=2077276 RepID=A0A9W6TPL8_9STRA|nr:unnamed protein product [Phytophthora lilii]